MKIPCRRVDSDMPEQALNGEDVGSLVEKVRRETVAESMDGDVLSKTAEFDVLFPCVLDAFFCQFCTLLVDEQPVFRVSFRPIFA